MAIFTEKSGNGSLNDVTPVTLVAAPSTTFKRVIKNGTIYNADTVDAVVIIELKDTGGSTDIMLEYELAPGHSCLIPDTILDTTTKSLTARLAGSITTNQPTYTVFYAETR